jgi:hypothetical protein
MNGTLATDGAVRSRAAGLIPVAARTDRSPSSSATRAYAASPATMTRADPTTWRSSSS